MLPILKVVKIGGNVLDNPLVLSGVLDVLASEKEAILLVHGGGKAASRLADQLGIQQQIIDGRRITDAATLDIATMVYGGLVNRQLVAQLQARGKNALGLTGADGNLLLAKKRPSDPIDYGFVGDVVPDGVNVAFAESLLQARMMPVVCALTHNGAGTLLNTNADTIASTLAIALSSRFTTQLIFVFEKKGVLADVNDANTLVPEIHLPAIESFIADGVIEGGMIPKIRNAALAVEAGVQQVRIGQAEDLSNMLSDTAGFFTQILA